MFSVHIDAKGDRSSEKPRSLSPLRRLTFADEHKDRYSRLNSKSWQPRPFARPNSSFQKQGRNFPSRFSGNRGVSPRFQQPATQRCSRCGRAAVGKKSSFKHQNNVLRR